MKESIIEKSYFTEKIRPYIEQPIIKILTGQIKKKLYSKTAKEYCLQYMDSDINVIYLEIRIYRNSVRL